MKTFKFTLARWLPVESDGSGNIYIDWPAVHRQAGLDHVKWLKEQKITECQLVVEQRKDDVYHYLTAEIYNEKLAALYSIMWAK